MNYFKLVAFIGTLAFLASCNDDDPEPEMPEPNIAELAAGNPDLSMLVEAVNRTGFTGSLVGPGPLTVLAPTNQAFQALLDTQEDWNTIADIDEDLLEAVLFYHIYSGSIASSSLSADQTLSSVDGEILTVTQVGTTVTFNGVANVVTPDVMASNGLVHVIDAVLLPPAVIESVTNTLRWVDSEDFGFVFTDGMGMTLYYFARDVDGNNNCSGGCANNWPKFHATSIAITGDEFDADLVGEIEVDGEMQTTYNGWPLYYFVNDAAAGDFNGEGAGGGNWYVAKPDYDIMLANDQLVGNDGENYIMDAEGVTALGAGNTFYFTDFDGRTLYRFVNDVMNQSNFGGNPAVWPKFTTAVTVAPSILSLDDFGVIADDQVAFRGNPLYYFGQDMARGETKGVSVPAPGIWPIVNATTAALAMGEE
ncbi:fasciclin domain-containing protein [Lunatimonas salinarum]|uniref:fasciclin domain-containing protein n=1 Tax=Lunatimonas salinarum TaxID=1774590 RepID=UPI001ADF03EC|nr:fasciclin domain-containing protein [Lunatimonas salinarum]